jgi:hypothetical protein
MTETIISTRTVIIEIGFQPTSRDVFSVEIFPPDSNGLLQISALANGKPIRLTPWRDSAEESVDRLIPALDRSTGPSHP